MNRSPHCARITRPVAYRAGSGRRRHVPVGPCLLQCQGDQSVDIVWGARGERCASLPIADIEAAREQGHLVLLD